MSENSRNYLKALYGFDATVRRAGDGVWGNHSPCPEWTAANVVGHNIAMNDMISGFTQGVGAAGAGGDAPDDPVGAWHESFERLQAALDSKGALQTVAKTPWGEMPVDKFLGFAWVDPVIHTWDLAKAIGVEPVMDEGQVARGFKQLERAGDSLVAPGRFDAAVDRDDSMTTIEKLAAVSGRDPRWG